MDDTENVNESAPAATAAAATTPAAPAPAAAARDPRTELRNSHWCVHIAGVDSNGNEIPGHGLGQIGEIGAQVTFHRFRMHSGDDAPSLDSEPVICELKDLRLCKPKELPAYLGYTPEQLKDLGYTS